MKFWSRLVGAWHHKRQRTKRKRALQKASLFDTELKAEFLNEIKSTVEFSHNNGNR